MVLFGAAPMAEAAFLALESGTDALTIDATKLTWACPLDLAGIVATAHWAAGCAMPVTLKMPADGPTASHLQRMDVLRLMPPRTQIAGRVQLDAQFEHQPRRLEVTPLNPANASDVAERLGHLITASYAEHSISAGRVLFRACGELITNAVEHGVGKPGAFLAAQAHVGSPSERPRLEFAVCDTGIGILQHLRQNPRLAYLHRDEIAISKAMEAGVSGVGDDRGNGLSDLIEHTRVHGEIDFQIRSGQGEVRVKGSPAAHSEEPRHRPDQTSGTWAWLSHTLLQQPSIKSSQ